VRDAKVTSVFYRRGEINWKPETDSSHGRVVVNADFSSVLERRGGKTFVKGRVADLAVVYLEHALKNAVPDGKLRAQEVLVRDEVIIAGFGATGPLVPSVGERHVGRNRVSMIRASSPEKGRELRLLFPGAHTHQGDSGGPCFREENGVRWLVGINGGYANVDGAPESWFTSTSSYREWIEEQIAAARKLESR
jgi:hypothetical protein